jgi:hypothetical protein
VGKACLLETQSLAAGSSAQFKNRYLSHQCLFCIGTTDCGCGEKGRNRRSVPKC